MKFEEAYNRTYPPLPEFKSVPVNLGLVSISHWGAFDISPYGCILRHDGRLDWQESGETFWSTVVDVDAFREFVRHVPT